ncbi:hypothetical protein MYAM1_000222 [Malassezia yamatoensis]|uniref:U3 small nucleolar RNA-associated protein 14 n=1 Tax=Malassezia yamatoensis TaxID=253288 RepID=A0AAJ5YQV1_9BASI|nr:hypothetical protein MYAM1_000222 [Malassezia yamatoensis]
MARGGKPGRRGRGKGHEISRRTQSDRYVPSSDEENVHKLPQLYHSDSDPDASQIQGDDEEIDSDEAFGEDDEDLELGHARKSQDRSTPEDFEDDQGEDLIELSNLLDDVPDSDTEAEPRAIYPDSDHSQDSNYQGAESEGLEEDLAQLISQRTKRSAEQSETQPMKRNRTERNEAVREGTDATSGSAKLRLEDLMSSLGQDTRVSSEVRALTKNRKSTDSAQPVASKRGGGTLRAPLPGIQQDRLDRQAAYKLSKDEVQGWAPTIKRLREAEHLSFPLQKPQQPPPPSNAGLAASFAPTTDMEKDVAALLDEGGLTEKQIAEQEGLAMKDMSKEEVVARQAELRRMRELMFRMEQKARRANKIKSKSYRRVHRRERERLQAQLANAQNLDQEHPEDSASDEDGAQRAAEARARERATLRHRNTGKWAKSRLGRHDDASRDARLAIEEQLQQGDALRRKVHAQTSDLDDSDEDSDSDSGHDAFDELEDFAERERARDQATEAQLESSGKPGKHVFGMKFMKDARDRQNKATQASIDEMRQALQDDSDGSEASAERIGRHGRALYGSGPIGTDQWNEAQVPNKQSLSTASQTSPSIPLNNANPWLGSEASNAVSREKNSVLLSENSNAATRSAHRQSRHASRTSESRDAAADDAALAVDADAHMEQIHAGHEHQSGSDSDDELAPVTTKHTRGRRGRGQRNAGLVPIQQRELVSEAFAGDDVMLDFQSEKQRAIRSDAPREESTELPGWGSWGGKGARRHPKNSKHVRSVPGLAADQRKDRAMDNVIINERLDKKAARYKAKDLPYPYTSAAQYEAAMRQPIGSEWNTRTQHQRLSLPRVSTKLGQRIDPIQRKF